MRPSRELAPAAADGALERRACPREPGSRGPERRRWRYFWPLAVFAVIGAFFAVGLTLDPREIPSPLLGKAVPEFTLPPVKGRTLGLSAADLRGEVSVVNVFASWCTACRDEHPLWMAVQRGGSVPLHGLNYKDRPDDAAKWLAELGDPYTRTGTDLDGRVGIDWGVYGVPETFIVDKRGVVRHKFIGAITREKLDAELMPFVHKLQAE